MKRLRNEGYNLVELMLVVAIVGILAAIALPNVAEFTKRARHSEAKTNLSSLYALEKTFQAEFQSYTSRFDSLGFTPSGILWYNIGFDNDFAPPTDAPAGTPTCTTACPTTNCPASIVIWQCTASSGNSLDGVGNAIAAAATFKAGTHAHFTPAPSDAYTWTIDHDKKLEQLIPAN